MSERRAFRSTAKTRILPAQGLAGIWQVGKKVRMTDCGRCGGWHVRVAHAELRVTRPSPVTPGQSVYWQDVALSNNAHCTLRPRIRPAAACRLQREWAPLSAPKYPNGVPSSSPGFGERSDAVPWVRDRSTIISATLKGLHPGRRRYGVAELNPVGVHGLGSEITSPRVAPLALRTMG